MNIIELHDKVLGFLDQARSGRISPIMIDSALNSSHVAVMNQKKGTEGLVSANYSPEESNRIKDSLRYYYKEATVTTAALVFDVEANISTDVLADFLDVQLNIGTEGTPNWVTPIPINRKDQSEVSGNTFLAAKNSGWPVFYYVYAGGILAFQIPGATTIAQIKVGYLKFPVTLYSGIHVLKADFAVNNKTVIVTSPRAVYSSAIKLRSEVITTAQFANLTVGDVCYDYAIVDVDPLIIDLVASMAATMIANLRVGVLNVGNQKGE